jgi:hypothetical protein
MAGSVLGVAAPPPEVGNDSSLRSWFSVFLKWPAVSALVNNASISRINRISSVYKVGEIRDGCKILVL